MTHFFIDYKHGSDKNDGLTMQTAVKTRDRFFSLIDKLAYQAYKKTLPLWRRLVWPWLTRKEKAEAMKSIEFEIGL